MTTPSKAQLQVIKRSGHARDFERDKIAVAISKAFIAAKGVNDVLHDRVESITDSVEKTLRSRYLAYGAVHIEVIQDQVELELMRYKEHQVARQYIIYREDHARERAAFDAPLGDEKTLIHVLEIDGSLSPVYPSNVQEQFRKLSVGLGSLDLKPVILEFERSIYEGMPRVQFDLAFMLSSRTSIEKGPEYGFLSARTLLTLLYHEVSQSLSLPSEFLVSEIPKDHYVKLFLGAIERGISSNLLKKEMGIFDMPRLCEAIEPSRDLNFQYLGLQTVYDRYLLHDNGVRFEMPQIFLMRVAMGLALLEDNPTKRAIEFYHLLSSFDFMCSTPTLFNSGTVYAQLSSCYLTSVPDDLNGIFQSYNDNAMLSKWAGGLGNDWTKVRAMGSLIKGTNGASQGVVPFLKIANDVAIAVNQGGKRKGAVCAYLESWHLDIEEFLELRKNTGDERRRTQDMNTANWVPDLFMKRVIKEEDWTLFSPSDVADLHELYGKAFEKRYEFYEKLADEGKIQHRRLPANELWRKMLSMLFETGHPWITFKDPCNIRSPQKHQGIVHSSNLCTEITLNTSADEVAVCNLGSVNLSNHMDTSGKLNQEKLKATVRLAVRMLDNVIDLNYYPIEKAKNANMRHRPIGLGIMGFQDALYLAEIPYASLEAIDFADWSMECLSYFALEASCELAKERGNYQTFEGSLWHQGVLPIDSLSLLKEERGEEYLKLDTQSKLDWAPLRERIQLGMRNSNVLAIAPTATISNIIGVSASIEPTYENLYVKSNLSGQFTIINDHLVKDLRDLGLWDDTMISELRYYDGSLTKISRIPEVLKNKYKTAFEVEPRWIVEAAARRQKWIDQAQSLNIYMAGTSGKALDITYKMAWHLGLKTTYYLRSKGATSVERTTMKDERLRQVPGVQESVPTLKEALVEAPKKDSKDFQLQGPACGLEPDDCEVCQ